jgi:hypothetical protein
MAASHHCHWEFLNDEVLCAHHLPSHRGTYGNLDSDGATDITGKSKAFGRSQ